MSLKVSRILHAGYLFESENACIAFDPIFENPFSLNCYAFPPVEFKPEKIKSLKLDAIFISHYHDDHCSFDSLKLLDRNIPIYMFCVFEEMFTLLRELGFRNVFSLELNRSIKIGSIDIIARRSLDHDVDSLFHIKYKNLNILNVVDSWIDYETLDLLSQTKWNLILWPFQTMREIEVLSPSRAIRPSRQVPSEWKEQIKILKPDFIVPSSCQFKFEDWSWYNQFYFPISYESFASEIKQIRPTVKVLKMKPSESFLIDEKSVQKSGVLDWVNLKTNNRQDYEYNETLLVPQTAEIAKNFNALDKEQTARVLDFCLIGILKAYKNLDNSEINYFKKEKVWKLSLYDHNGEVKDYFYAVSNDSIFLLTNQEKFDWLTEVPQATLLLALEGKASLNALYVRINDCQFTPAIEAQIEDADVMEDILIRCLYSGQFAAYQKQQLKNIKLETSS